MIDLIRALRVLKRTPWYATAVVAVLAAALSLTTVVFAVADGVLFKPLPYARPGELYLIRAIAPTPQGPRPSPVSLRDVDAWSVSIPDLRLSVVGVPSLCERSDGQEYCSAGIDEHFFDVLGVQPMLGGFSAGDFDLQSQAESARARWTPLLVSHRYWRRVLGGDATVLGRTVPVSELEGRTFGRRVSGVLPADFVFPVDGDEPQPDMLRPIPRAAAWWTRQYQVLARVPPGVPRVDIEGRLAGVARVVPAAPPPHGHGQPTDNVLFSDVRLVPLTEHLGRHERPAFGLVLAASALLLLLAAVNVAGLAAARNVERQRDTAVRRALGARPWHLIRGVAAEVVLLGAAGTAVALVVSRPLLDWTLALLPAGATLLKEPSLDARVFAAVALVSIAMVALVALWPARVAVSVGARSHGFADTVTLPLRRSGRALVGSQVALGFILVAAGALTIASLAAAWLTNPGYRRDRMLLFEAFATHYVSSADARDQLRSARATLSAMPAVEGVAVSTIQPFFAERSARASSLVPKGWSAAPEGVALRQVSANYFELMGIGLIEGRVPEEDEWERGTIALVSDSAARVMWPGRHPIGQVLTPARPSKRERDRVVVGVVADARYEGLDQEPAGDIYVGGAIVQGRTGVFLHVKTAGDAAALLPVLARTLRERKLLLEQAWTHQAALFDSVRHLALSAWLFGFLSVAAVVVLASGIFGLLAATVARRTREIGVRLALGATPARLVRMLIAEQGAAVVVGLLTGALVSAWAVRLLEAQLYGVQPYDFRVWLAVAGLLAAVSLAGTLVPSLRASRTNPVTALRAE